MFCFCFGCAAARNGSEEFDDVVGVGEGRNNATNNKKTKKKKNRRNTIIKKAVRFFVLRCFCLVQFSCCLRFV